MTIRQTVALTVMGAALSAPVTRAQTPVETVHLVITGGPNAGTYEATGVSAGCSAGLTGPNSFGNQLSSTKGEPTAFNSLQLVVSDAKAAAAGSPDFLITVGFGPLLHRTATYTVDTRPSSPKKTGKGTVTLQDGGATAKVTINATTDANVKIDATIDCKRVVRQ